MVDSALYFSGRREEQPCGREELAFALARARTTRDGFLWIGLADPQEGELQWLGQVLGLHALAVEDAEKGRQRPKLESYDGTVVLAVRSVHYDEAREQVETGQVLLLVGNRFVATVRHGQAVPLAERRAGLELRPELLAAGPSAVVHAVLDEVVDGYGRVLADLENDVEEIETAVFANDRTNHARRIYRLKREVLEFRRAVHPLVEPLRRLAEGRVPALLESLSPTDLQAYYRDVLDHLSREADLLDSLDRLLDSASDANASQVAMDQNDDQRKISAWAAIALVPTVIAGVYGMNFQNMPELAWRFGYPAALLFIAMVCTTLYRGFRRNGWL